MQILAKSLVVAEQECFVLLNWTAESGPELVALIGRSGALIEVIGSIERIVAYEFVHTSVQLVCSRLGDDRNLSTRPLSIFGAIGVAEHVEFANRVHTEQQLARASRLHVIFRRTGKFHAVQQEQILLGPVARDGEVVPDGGVRYSNPSGLLRSEINDSRIQREQFVVAPSVQGQVFYFSFDRPTRRCPWL